jgi:hypothetical protein
MCNPELRQQQMLAAIDAQQAAKQQSAGGVVGTATNATNSFAEGLRTEEGQAQAMQALQAKLHPESVAEPVKVALWHEPNPRMLADSQQKLPATMQQKISKTKEEVFKQTGLDVKNPVLSAVFGSRKVLSERELVEKLKNMTPQQWRDMQIEDLEGLYK